MEGPDVVKEIGRVGCDEEQDGRGEWYPVCERDAERGGRSHW